MRAGLRIALIHNLKQHVPVAADAPADALAEYDSLETVEAIRDALLAGGHQTVCLEADETLLDTVREAAPDICFNVAEGLRGDAREAQVPAMLEILGIPYTGSRVLAQAISLDKAVTKRLWREAGLPTAPFQVLERGDERLDPKLSFPLFVKPLREGTGMGINGSSVVCDAFALRRQAAWVIAAYRQPALVEGYLPGREFTVGLVGNRPAPGERRRNGLYAEHGYHLFPVLEIDATHSVGRGLYHAAAKAYSPGEVGAPLYLCPATIPRDLERTLERLAIEAFETIGALDLGRVDFRLDADGEPCLLEINTLPGLNPRVSDLCIMAAAEGFAYRDLIGEILNLAMERYGHPAGDERKEVLPLNAPGVVVAALGGEGL